VRPAGVKAVGSTQQAEVQVAKARSSANQWQDPDWGELVDSLGLSGSVRMLASNCVLERRDGNTIYFSLDPRSDSYLTAPRKEAIAEALSRHFDERLRVDVSISESVGETPNQVEVRVADEKMSAARAALESDPNVQTLKNMFGAELNPDSIELINPPQSD
jgi:DNA polymerase-3 subunit gamma/tau